VTDDPSPSPPPTVPPGPVDPVLERRNQIRRLLVLAQRIGYVLYAIAIAGFILGFARNFDGVSVTIITVGLVAGSLFLAPAYTFIYAVKAADRADADNDWR